MRLTKKIILAAGGTGGHVFAAVGVMESLKNEGYEVDLITDRRGLTFVKAANFHQIHMCHINRGKGLWRFLTYPLSLIQKTLSSIFILKREKPSFIMGFGGYPTVPPLLAGFLLGIPILIHEQNTFLGKANRFLGRFAKVIFLSFEGKNQEMFKNKSQVVGPVVRDFVLSLAELNYQPQDEEGKFNIGVLGGSQGAKILSLVIPEAVKLLPQDYQSLLKIFHQCRPECIPQAKKISKSTHSSWEIKPFFNDMKSLYKETQLIIARSGASTLAELALAGKPAILIPFAGSVEGDQAENANYLASREAAIVIEEKNLSPELLAKTINSLLNEPEKLNQLSRNIRLFAKIDTGKIIAETLKNI